jgi:hypothetical protein
MTISKNEFKIIYNHMKTLSKYNIQNLIKQVEQGKTNNDDINQIINVNSNKKVVKFMNKINILMFGGAETNETTSSEIPNNTVNVANETTSSEMPNNTAATDKTTDVEMIKEDIKNIIEKLKIKSDLLKEKEKELIARENEISTKEKLTK